MSKELSEMCPLGEKMAKIWLKLQENGENKSQMAKVMAKEKYILARTLTSPKDQLPISPVIFPLPKSIHFSQGPVTNFTDDLISP